MMKTILGFAGSAATVVAARGSARVAVRTRRRAIGPRRGVFMVNGAGYFEVQVTLPRAKAVLNDWLQGPDAGGDVPQVFVGHLSGGRIQGPKNFFVTFANFSA